ncbi:nitrate- and nitrite sensing domain-containing protein [Micromonospora chaiyaphumensis]|uniref:histidine kinase n=1 Tax=Micromonospora chaiyaphumensis TaxID=307119 RepID=A0A1C4ZH78_9ACTN|nr:nitrate- and nitrite sensing domain-containing protein [Micromonospora chaiyaphumensis]SCF32174.1 Signal transduction histidine kinase [Micromonospora chaiyaphumensis]
MNTRDWPIRAKLTALVIGPVTGLLALWIFATTLTFGPALDLLAARTLLYDLGRPGESVVAELQRERRLSVVQLAGDTALPALAEQRTRTDQAIAELRRRVDGEKLRDAADDLLDVRLDQLVSALDALPAGRGFIDGRKVDQAGAVGLYSGMIGSAFQTFSAMATLPDTQLNREALALTGLGRSRELLGQADALLAGAVTAGRYADGEHEQLVRTIENQRFLAENAVADLPPAERTDYQRLTEGEAFVRLRALQDTLVRSRDLPAGFDIRAWETSHAAVWQGLRDFELHGADTLAERSVPMAVQILVRLAAAGVLGLVAIVVCVLVALRVGRSLDRRLTGVRTAALEMAEERLPDVVARLRRGEVVDVAREAPELDHGGDEIGQVGRAFNEVRRTAVQAAVDEVTLRRGLNEVFLNIARRSQGLVHRQLALLDRLERRTEDPDELAGLFQVDHLATRLRRHAEDLVILAGAAPGRGWRNPVAAVDVVRGAISEVESYDRIDVGEVQPAGVLGRAVGDLIHLLAELLENATVFSSPGTRVDVGGRTVPGGYVIEITDRGLGMSAPALAEANRKLSRAPEFDPTDSARLGHFVVARLAARHGVRVELRPAAPGGITAAVFVPSDLVTAEPAIGATGPGAGSSGRDDRRMAKVTRLGTVPRTRAARPGRDRPESAVVPLPAGRASAVETPADGDGLPRRVRRRGPAARPRPVVADNPAHRPPEEARRAMSALQAGTARGRRDGARDAADRRNSAPAAAADPAADRRGPAPTATGGSADDRTAAPDRAGAPSTDAARTRAAEPSPPEPAAAPDHRTATERDA